MFALDTHEPQITSADGLKIWAAQAGRPAADAPTIVFIPGFSSSSLLFDHQFRDKELLSQYCLITYEPRGQGRSQSPTEASQWASLRQAQDFEAVCQHYGASKVFVAGWSAGCCIVSDIFEHKLGHLVAGLIFMAGMPALALFGGVNYPSVRQYYDPLMDPNTNGDNHGPSISDFLDVVVWKPNRAKMSYTFRSALVGTIAMSSTTVRTASQVESRQDPTNMLCDGPNYESIFIVGDEEEVVQPDAMIAKYKEMFPRVEVARIPEAGHTVYWERPEQTKKAIVDFIERVIKA
ncbi:hypothetical protein SBRCBS47491_002191 [Sporothrix bragantina]|uniref:AB hydrolase-1 domain-containing protein n=1 Tax=Sporothrix bragantina TaxID=671064 RepID=A0ABP0B516_9PEZI